MADVHEMVRQEKPYPERRLRGVLEELATGCSRYVTLAQGKGGGPSAGRNKLDKERLRLCQREIVSLTVIRALCVCGCVCVCVSCLCVCVFLRVCVFCVCLCVCVCVFHK